MSEVMNVGVMNVGVMNVGQSKSRGLFQIGAMAVTDSGW